MEVNHDQTFNTRTSWLVDFTRYHVRFCVLAGSCCRFLIKIKSFPENAKTLK